MNKKQYVFVNGYGLVRFNKLKMNVDCQWQGDIKLPKGVKTGTGCKWREHDYWFKDTEIFNSKRKAIQSLCKIK